MPVYLIYFSLLLSYLVGFGENILVAFDLLIDTYMESSLSMLLNSFCGAYSFGCSIYN